MSELEIFIDTAKYPLVGSLCLPMNNAGEKFPLVLMIHGSGPMDRNENMPGQSLNIFNVLAADLAVAGVASFRYDKRGCGKSGGIFNQAGHLDHLQDARHCLEYLIREKKVQPKEIFVLGHSEGTLIAAAIATDDLVAGIILLTPFVQNIEKVLHSQAINMKQSLEKVKNSKGFLYRLLASLSGDPVKNQNRLIQKIKNSSKVSIRHRFERVNARWLRELFEINPAELFKKITCPTLLIGGTKDLQCSPEDTELAAKLITAPVEKHLIPDLTHILRKDNQEHDFLRYADLLKVPMDVEVREKIINWIKKNS